MDRKPPAVAIRALAALVLIAVTLVPAVRGNDADTPRFFAQPSAQSSYSAPIIVAQGRCYNGRCY